MGLSIAVPRESRRGEARVAMVPDCAARLVRAGHHIRLQRGAGMAAGHEDADYVKACRLAEAEEAVSERPAGALHLYEDFAATVEEADIIVKVSLPTEDEIPCLSTRVLLVCLVAAFQHVEELEALRGRGVSLIGMDHLPRITRAQPMDALSSQATVAGYKAALMAAELSPRLFPMLTTAAGTIHPSRVLVIGAGVAGLQAIATARRLGAQVEAYDVRRAAKEQIASVGARAIDTGVEIVGRGGHARPLRKDELKLQHEVLARHLAAAHVVICAASIPGHPAPLIVTEDMVDGMLPKTVIIDLAASTGGNCVLTRPGEELRHGNTLIVGALNLPSLGAVHASDMYARNILNMLNLLTPDGTLFLNADDAIIRHCLLLHRGQVHHERTAQLLQRPCVPFGDVGSTAEELLDDVAGWVRTPEPPPTSDAGGRADADPQHAAETSDSDAAGAGSSAEAAPGSASGDTAGSAPRPQGPEKGDEADDLSATLATDGESDEDEEEESEVAELDDLTAIEGIGPAVQGRLRAFGIERYEQLAELDDDGMRRLIDQVELSTDMLDKQWPAQAARLLEERKH